MLTQKQKADGRKHLTSTLGEIGAIMSKFQFNLSIDTRLHRPLILWPVSLPEVLQTFTLKYKPHKREISDERKKKANKRKETAAENLLKEGRGEKKYRKRKGGGKDEEEEEKRRRRTGRKRRRRRRTNNKIDIGPYVKTA